MAGLPLAGALFGLCLGGPVGLLAGAKLGGVAAVGGSILGYTGASVIKEQNEIRKFVDDYKKEPDLFVQTPGEDENQRTTKSHRNGSTPRRLTGGPRTANPSPSARRRIRSQRQESMLAIPQPNSPLTESKPGLKLPPHLQLRHFRRMGDLSEAEQRSIVALINKDDPVVNPKTLIVTAIVCDTHAEGEQQTPQHQAKKTQRRSIFRASSLPDVLEEDKIIYIP
jgi:hypothetical protein